jgi:hypothetical protein
MERGTFIQHVEAKVIYEESSIYVDGNRVILDVYIMMKGEKKKVKKPSANANKLGEKECQYGKKSNH